MTGRDPAAPGPNDWECGECGALNPLDENICDNCGYDQDGNPTFEDEEIEDDDVVED